MVQLPVLLIQAVEEVLVIVGKAAVMMVMEQFMDLAVMVQQEVLEL